MPTAPRDYVGGMRHMIVAIVLLAACGSEGETITGLELCNRWVEAYCTRADECSGVDAGCEATIGDACCGEVGCAEDTPTPVSDADMAICEQTIAVAGCEDDLPQVPPSCELY